MQKLNPVQTTNIKLAMANWAPWFEQEVNCQLFNGWYTTGPYGSAVTTNTLCSLERIEKNSSKKLIPCRLELR